MTAARPISDGPGYATSDALARLAEALRRLTETTRETGWHTPSLVLSHGNGEEEVAVGVRWIDVGDGGYYVAEIR